METLRLASINILNKPKNLQARYEELGKHLEIVAPTVVAVQEVIDEKLLTATVASLGYHYHSFTTYRKAKDAKLDTAGFLSKIPLKNVKPIIFANVQRRGLMADVESQGITFRLATAHFEWGGTREAARLAQAQEISLLAEKYKTSHEEHFVLLGDLNSDEDSRTIRYLQGKDLGLHNNSTYWTDAYRVCGNPELWATSDHSTGELGPTTARNQGIIYPQFLPPRRIDYIFVYGWAYGRIGGPVAYGRFGQPLDAFSLEVSDHYGVWVDLLTAP